MARRNPPPPGTVSFQGPPWSRRRQPNFSAPEGSLFRSGVEIAARVCRSVCGKRRPSPNPQLPCRPLHRPPVRCLDSFRVLFFTEAMTTPTKAGYHVRRPLPDQFGSRRPLEFFQKCHAYEAALRATALESLFFFVPPFSRPSGKTLATTKLESKNVPDVCSAL